MPVTLELGGKSPNIVFDDADFEAAVVGAISGIFAATGQTCIAGSRLLVQRNIHDKFVKRLVEIASEAKIGDPMLAETHVGPVTTPPQFQKVLDQSFELSQMTHFESLMMFQLWKRSSLDLWIFCYCS